MPTIFPGLFQEPNLTQQRDGGSLLHLPVLSGEVTEGCSSLNAQGGCLGKNALFCSLAKFESSTYPHQELIPGLGNAAVFEACFSTTLALSGHPARLAGSSLPCLEPTERPA